MPVEIFKPCPGCGEWFSLDDILDMPALQPTGLTIDPSDQDNCYFHFIHMSDGCNSSFVIHSADLERGLRTPIQEESEYGQDHCPGYCARVDELKVCKNNCRLSRFREILLDMIERRKETAATGS